MVNEHPIMQRVRQFELKHGDDGIQIDDWKVFSNGAMRELSPYGLLMEPDPDPYKRCKVQVRYHETLLQRAVREFEHLKRHLMSLAKANLRERRPPPSPDKQAVRELKELQAIVREHQRNLDEARKQLKQNKPGWMVAQETSAAAQRGSNEDFIAELRAIDI